MRNNPYQNTNGTWLRGSFHGHCDEHSACASVPLIESVAKYASIGVGFVTITDHDHVTDLNEVQTSYPDLVFLEGFEYSSRENVLFAGTQVEPLYQLPLENALSKASDLLTVVCHPRPHANGKDYWTRAMLEELGVMPDGVEVFNGHYGIPSALEKGRQPLYTEFWDELLTAGHQLWGFANDDFHDWEDFNNAFNMVCVNEVSPHGILSAAKAGRCYASTGLYLKRVTVDNNYIHVVVDQPCVGLFIGPNGQTLGEDQGTEFTFSHNSEAYVRFQGDGDAGQIFLQPMWIN